MNSGKTHERRWLLGVGTIVVSALIGTACQSNLPPGEPSTHMRTASPQSTSASTNLPSAPIVATEVERSAEELWSLLQQAEDSRYAILIRHATAPGTGDPPTFQLDEQTTQVQQFLLENQDASGITIMVSHQVNITALSGIFPQSGEAVVIQISDDNQLIILGRLPTS